jgi:hypothetical protein
MNMPENQQQDTQNQEHKNESPEVWKQRFEETVAARDQLRESNRLIKEQLDKVSSELNQFKTEAQKAQEREEQVKLESKGKYQEALKTVEEKYSTQFKSLQSAASQRLIPLAIRSAATGLGNLTPEAAQDLPVLLRDHIGLDPNTLEVFVKDNEGKPMTGPDLKPIPVEAFVAEFVKTRPYLVKGTVPTQHGINGMNQKLTVDDIMNDPKLMAEYAEKNPVEFANMQADYFSPKNVQKRAQGKK